MDSLPPGPLLQERRGGLNHGSGYPKSLYKLSFHPRGDQSVPGWAGWTGRHRIIDLVTDLPNLGSIRPPASGRNPRTTHFITSLAAHTRKTRSAAPVDLQKGLGQGPAGRGSSLMASIPEYAPLLTPTFTNNPETLVSRPLPTPAISRYLPRGLPLCALSLDDYYPNAIRYSSKKPPPAHMRLSIEQ